MNSICVFIVFVTLSYTGLYGQLQDNAKKNIKTFFNPLYCADYPDPDIIRAGNDFYMVCSSFNYSPGLPVYHSKDLVHWLPVSHVFQKQIPDSFFNIPRHGMGCWAPSIRYHNNRFYVYYADPDYGIYLSTAKDPKGPWTPVKLVVSAKGWIDPCPFWDDDGKAYLVHAWAKSRSGIKSMLTLHRMSLNGERLLDDGQFIFDGRETQPTIEGPKMYKRNGYYFIFAPAGGVKTGWQAVLRSKNIYGPYEEKIVMDQGTSEINGPHQGGWVELASGENWFIHFQDKGAYGRILHLQPMTWEGNWPVIGIDYDNDGKGEPVNSFTFPNTGNTIDNKSQQTSDEFNDTTLALQWHWQANYKRKWYSLFENPGWLRLKSTPIKDSIINLWNVPQLFLQKFPAEEFEITAKADINQLQLGDIAGLTITGKDYARLAITNEGKKYTIGYVICEEANNSGKERIIESHDFTSREVYLQLRVKRGASCFFGYSSDGRTFNSIGNEFKAKEDIWVGANVGLYCICGQFSTSHGYADFDWFRVTYIDRNVFSNN